MGCSDVCCQLARHGYYHNPTYRNEVLVRLVSSNLVQLLIEPGLSVSESQLDTLELAYSESWAVFAICSLSMSCGV
jgi:hypothetical protein